MAMKISDVVFTTHAIDRMRERGIEGNLAHQTVKAPDNANPGKEKFTTEFVKKYDTYKITVIGKKNDIGEWLVLSVWRDPPLPGTKDYKKREKYYKKMEKTKRLDKKMENASFFGKLWITVRKQIGI